MTDGGFIVCNSRAIGVFVNPFSARHRSFQNLFLQEREQNFFGLPVDGWMIFFPHTGQLAYFGSRLW